MDFLLYAFARAVIGLLQALPLPWVARLGRFGGGAAYWLDARHRRVAIRNLKMCFGHEKSGAEIRAIARENFHRIGESFGCAAKTASMTFEELKPHVEYAGSPDFDRVLAERGNIVVAIGHFGNFELYGRFVGWAPSYRCATTYRGLRQPRLNRLLQTLRERSGCTFFERRNEGPALRAFMKHSGIILGLLSDQHAGKSGLRLPFLGHECSTSTAPAVFALRYDCALLTGICYRIGLARWRMEAGELIPTTGNGEPRTTEAIMRDVNRAFETAIRRDPANWFWVHNRWKPASKAQLKRKAAHAAQAFAPLPESDHHEA
jgi:lauroyl/myristoyl acyltransferase